MPRQSSNLHVYAALCSWNGHISQIGLAGEHRLPCCPHCRSMLFQIDEDRWQSGAREHEEKGHTHYVEFMSWCSTNGKCWRSLEEAALHFERATGRTVILTQ